MKSTRYFKAFQNTRIWTWLRVLTYVVLISYLSILMFPVRYWGIEGGSEASFRFALNYSFANDFIFGRDVFWTYGPFAFLCVPMAVGNNMEIAFTFQYTIWIIFIVLISYASLKEYTDLYRLSIFTVLAICYHECLHGDATQSDYFISYIGIILLSLCQLNKQRQHFFYILSNASGVLLLFIKPVPALIVLSSCFMYAFLLLWQDKKSGMKLIGTFCLTTVLLFCFIYLVYNPDLSDMMRYIRGVIEISSGYSVALGGFTDAMDTSLIFLSIISFVILAIIQYIRKKSIGIVLISCCFGLFFPFKHAIVQGGVQKFIVLFNTVMFFIAFACLFSNIQGKQKMIFFPVIIINVLIWGNTYHRIYGEGSSARILNRLSGYSQYEMLNRTLLDFNGSKRDFIETPRRVLKEKYRLPQHWLEEIGDSTVTIYTYDLAYAFVNNLNFVPLPVFQTYSAYTDFFDDLFFEFFDNMGKAPRFILIQAAGMDLDFRHPFVDTPGGWLAVYKWYDLYRKNGDLILLKRRQEERFHTVKKMFETKIDAGQLFTIPSSDRPVIIKLYSHLDLLGKLKSILWRTAPPQYKLDVFTQNDNKRSYNTSPFLFRNGMIINCFPVIPQDMISLLQDALVNDPIAKVRFNGPHLRRQIKVKCYTIPEITLQFAH